MVLIRSPALHFRLTGHNSPLREREEEASDTHPGHNINIIDVINYYIDQGVPRYAINACSTGKYVQCTKSI